jgi:hypothetical protein
MERVPFTVRTDALMADSPEALAVLAKLKLGQRVQVAIYQERPNFLSNRAAKVFELIATAHGMRVKNVRGWIAVATGRAEIMHVGGGKIITIPHGTGPRDMSMAEFEAFWEDAVAFISKEILPTISQKYALQIEPLLWTETGDSRTAPASS